jgi:ADP-ribose pyrophosphatase YjhB (NUDIX family)
MFVVRSLYRALNAADLDALAALYDTSCTVEQVFAGDPGTYDGLPEVRRRWADELRRFSGALPGDRRVDVGRIAGIETGWGWVQAEWIRGTRERETGEASYDTGYSHFWIESGLIRRHRSVVRHAHGASRPEPDRPSIADASTRRYPALPVVGIGAIIFDDQRRVVLVKRQYEPLAGQWSLPGGRLELGESLETGVAREAREETGLIVEVGPVVDVFDRILLDDEARVRYHYVLVDYLCRCRGGTLAAGGDVIDVALIDLSDLHAYRLTEMAESMIVKARDLL